MKSRAFAPGAEEERKKQRERRYREDANAQSAVGVSVNPASTTSSSAMRDVGPPRE